ncbi:MSLN protein, partial [Chordeiles acutipennis]|nr:MSLN protein [Chordeiles acutipennis]
ASVIINRYVGLGNAWSATALNAIGTKYVCLLSESELNKIEPNSLKMVHLDPSACSQLTKNILYAKAKRAFSDQHNAMPAYYELIEPYLGILTPPEVRGLLGLNLRDLLKWQNTSPIREWIRMQKQSQLDELNIGLTGGTQEGYINIVTPKFQPPSSASLGTVAVALHLLPALLISFVMMSILS